jgi:uncharacterized protein YprB with RNaseH-like and TPR domain
MAIYLDIETTFQGELTVVGFTHVSSGTVQLVAPAITGAKLLAALPRAEAIFTYNGDRFDLPIIRQRLGVDLTTFYKSIDLMKTCHKARLYGGLKGVERTLGIDRADADLDGKAAIALWDDWNRTGDRAHLDRLLSYNREDCENLVQLRRCLAERGFPT